MPLAGETILASDILDRRGVQLERIANQAVTTGGAVKPISWDTEGEDTDTYWASGTPTVVTIPPGLSGIYLITFRAAGLASVRAMLEIVATTASVPVPVDWRMPIDVTEDRAGITVCTPLDAGDTFVCNVFHNTGADVQYTAWMSCYRVSF